jgi:hypothetical protein
MPNTNQILFIVIIVIIFSLSLIGLFYLMNKASNRRRELYDLEQRLQVKEQLHIQYLAKQQQSATTVLYQPAMIKQGHAPIPSPIVMMTPKKQEIDTNSKKTKRESLLNRVYGFRNVSTSPPPFLAATPQRPSSIRPPSFLPMQEKQRCFSPPAYGDYRNSIPVKLEIDSTDNKQ